MQDDEEIRKEDLQMSEDKNFDLTIQSADDWRRGGDLLASTLKLFHRRKVIFGVRA